MQGAKLWPWHLEAALSVRGNVDMVRLSSTCMSHLQVCGSPFHDPGLAHIMI